MICTEEDINNILNNNLNIDKKEKIGEASNKKSNEVEIVKVLKIKEVNIKIGSKITVFKL